MAGIDLIIQHDEEDADAAEILVEGSVDNRPYRFLLDTGAARTGIISDDYIATMPAIARKDSAGAFTASQDEMILIPHITLGSISKHDFPVARLKAINPAQRNLIGMDILKDVCCHFLFDQGYLSFENIGGDSLLFHDLLVDKHYHPYVDIAFGNVQAQTVWDTGAGFTVVDNAFIEQHPDLFQEVGSSMGTDAGGATMETPMYIMASANIGGQPFAPHKVAGVDLSHVNATTEKPMTMILGYSTLRQANWLFDFPRKRWAISKFLQTS